MMAPPPPEFLEVRCAGCGETLEVERGLTEFACPDCGAEQALPPELMPPPPPRPRRALPIPGRGPAVSVPVPVSAPPPARMPCAGCSALLSVPAAAGLGRFACPVCGVELLVDGGRLRPYLDSPAAAAAATVSVVALPPTGVTYTRQPREVQVERYNHPIRSDQTPAQYPSQSVHREETSSSFRPDTRTPIHSMLAQKGPLRHSVQREESHTEPRNGTAVRSGTRNSRLQPGTQSVGLQKVQPESSIQVTSIPQAHAFFVRGDHTQGQHPDIARNGQQTNDVSSTMEQSEYFFRSAEMSNLVKCYFYYGSGRVQINELGADLSQFQSVELDLTAPQTWSVSQLKDWLAGCLGLNPETYTVGVHALWTRSSSNIFWYLRHIDRTSQWVGWLQGCQSRGINPVALLLPVAKAVSMELGKIDHLDQAANVEPTEAKDQCKTSGWSIERKERNNSTSGHRKGLKSSVNEGLHVRRSKHLTKQTEHPIDDEPVQKIAASPNACNSDRPDIDRIIANLCPSSLHPHQMPQTISSELDNVDAAVLPAFSNPGRCQPEQFSHCYSQYHPSEVRGAHQLDKSGEQVKPQSPNVLHQAMHVRQENAYGGHLLSGSYGKSSRKRNRRHPTRLDRGRYYGLAGIIDKAKIDELAKSIPGSLRKRGQRQKFSQDQVQQMINQAVQGLNETWENKFKSLEQTIRSGPSLGVGPEHTPGSSATGRGAQEDRSPHQAGTDSQQEEGHQPVRHEDGDHSIEEVVSTSV